MAETNDASGSHKPDGSDTPRKAAEPQFFEQDEGPGITGVELSHVKEYLRDLADDDQLPRNEKANLRVHYLRREQWLHAKLAFFEKQENLQAWERWLQSLGNPDATRSEGDVKQTLSTAQDGLTKAKEELRIATSYLENLPSGAADKNAQKAEARKWLLSRKWEAITPEELKPAVEGARHTIEHYGFWQSRQSTERLCYAALHPTDIAVHDPNRSDNLDSYRRFLVGLLGPKIEQKLLNADHSPPVIFKSYLDVLQAAMKALLRRGFNLMLQIAEPCSSVLRSHPVEWTKRHLEILVSAEKSAIRGWILYVCDPPDLSATTLSDDSIFRGEWRAPRLIHMRPAGNTAYEQDTTWTREPLVRSQEVLESLVNHFMTFLRLELNEIVRNAHFDFIKRNGVRSATWKAAPTTNVSPPSTAVQTTAENQVPDVWRSLREKFRKLADEEAGFAQTATVGNLWLHAAVDYESQTSSIGDWHLSGGMSAYLREHFEVEATRAGIALDSKLPAEPLTLWLHQLFSHLMETKSSLLFAATETGGIITRVIEASAIFCARLEKLALIRQGGIPSPSAVESQTAASQKEMDVRPESGTEHALREAVIKKVQNPDRYTVLSIPETALYFETSPRTIHRWLADRSLKRGARRSSVTIESILALKNKKARKARLH